jgi:tRNA(Ile)-lysidine synthase TilS/MesJ
MTKEELKFCNNFTKDFGRSIHKYSLLKENDKVLVGLSGGKDSYVLLENLLKIKKHLPFKYEISAAHIIIKNIDYKINLEFMQRFCNENNVKLYIEETKFDDKEANKKGICFVCSWYRRKMLFKLTNNLNYNKLAMGHHLDDTIEALLINMIFHSTITSIPQNLTLFNGRLKIIRPLLLHTRERIKTYASYRKFPEEIKSCPYIGNNIREEIKELINKMEALNKNARINLFRAHKRIDDEYLPK